MNNQSELLVLYPVYIAHRSHCEISLKKKKKSKNAKSVILFILTNEE